LGKSPLTPPAYRQAGFAKGENPSSSPFVIFSLSKTGKRGIEGDFKMSLKKLPNDLTIREIFH
jgi:hypothetical protein